jgi:hypothetical protein
MENLNSYTGKSDAEIRAENEARFLPKIKEEIRQRVEELEKVEPYTKSDLKATFVYLSDLITNGSDTIEPDAFDRFHALGKLAIRSFEGEDVRIISPLELNKTPDGKSWEHLMAKCLVSLMDCDVILMGYRWKDSKGARLEYQFAKELGLKIYFANEDFQQAKT